MFENEFTEKVNQNSEEVSLVTDYIKGLRNAGWSDKEIQLQLILLKIRPVKDVVQNRLHEVFKTCNSVLNYAVNMTRENK